MFKNNFTITNIISVFSIDSGNISDFRNFSGKFPHNELIFKTSGKTKIKFDNYTFTDEKNSVRFLPKQEKSIKYAAITLEPGSCIDIIFDTATPINEKPFSLKAKNSNKLYYLFTKAENAWRKKQHGYENTVLGCLYEILGILQYEAAYVPKSKIQKINKGIEFINQNFTKEITSEKLSEICNISYTYFKKIFKEYYGCTPHTHIIQLRMQYACDLLSAEQYKINEIAQLCGYQNVFYFSTSFKNFFGMSPTEYQTCKPEKQKNN